MRKTLLLGTALTVAATGMGVAQAQDEDVIVVTATKREQTLQEVPVAVSVVDEQVIERAQITDLLDLQSVVPSLRVAQFQQSGNLTYAIRGFGNGANNIGLEPSVAVFIDGVYRSRSSASITDLPGVERVEVLRGPQSTLFGKNASVGVVSFVTREPDFDWGGELEGTIGNYGQMIGKAYLTGPLADDTAFSLAASFNQRDGYADNEFAGGTLNGRDRWAVRGQTLYEGQENLSVRLIADYDRLEEDCCYVPYIQVGALSQAFFALGAPALSDDPFEYEAFTDIQPSNELINFGGQANVTYDFDNATLTSITSIRKQEYTANIDADFSPVNALQENRTDYDIETFTQELRVAGTTGNLDYLVGGFYFDERLDAGGNVVNGPALRPYVEILAGGGDQAEGAAVIGGLEQVFGFDPGSFYAAGNGSFESFVQDNKSYSIFAQGDYAINDRLTATLGVAYTFDEKEVRSNVIGTEPFYQLDLDGAQGQAAIGALLFASGFGDAATAAVTAGLLNPADIAGGPSDPAALNAYAVATAGIPGFPTIAQIQAGAAAATPGATAQFQQLQFIPPFTNFPNSVEDGMTEDDDITYTVRLAYDVTDFVNVYASYATGFKASSFNLTRDSDPLPDDLAALVAAGEAPANAQPGTRFAGPESTEVFEVGVKADLERGFIALTAFNQTVEDFQSAIFVGTGFVLANAGEQETNGIELESTFNPVDPLTLTFSGTYLDSEYVEFAGASGPTGPVDLSGTTVTSIPELSLYTAVQYDMEFGNGMGGFVRGDWVYQDDTTLAENVPDNIRRGERNLFNASAGVEFDSGVSAFIWGRNLTDEESYQSAFPTTVQPGSYSGYPIAPQTYGVTVRTQW